MQKKLLTNVNKLSNGRWARSIWYMDEHGERQRKGFTGKTKQVVNDQITDYITNFNSEIADSQEATKTLRESMQRWLEVFKFPSVERTTYDRSECTSRTQIYPVLGYKVIGNITAADIKSLLNQRMNEGYAYTTVKKIHVVLNEYFRYLTQQEFIDKNPMILVPMIKRANFLAAQDKEDLPESEKLSVFTPEEIEKFKAEAFRCWGTGKRIYRQPAAYILMLNTGLRMGELLGLLNSDIDLEKRVIHLQRGAKVILKRDGTTATGGTELKIGILKSASSKRDVPLNATAIAMIEDLRREAYFGEDTPLVCNENGGYTLPEYFRKRYYRILKAAGTESRGACTIFGTLLRRA